MTAPVDAKACVQFWREAGPDKWFVKDPAFDQDFRDRFLHNHFAAASRQCDDWLETPEGALALMVLLDQLPRNVFRGTAHMFATDPLARHLADRAIAMAHDTAVADDLAIFFYLPFEHSEDMADQNRSVALFERLDPKWMPYAITHRDIIARFGRFPHRNLALGRISTGEELGFLAEGGFSG